MLTPAAIFRQTLEHFTTEFLHNPYLCYTEHGLHARFYAQLYDALAPEQRYLTWQGQRVCVVQKEYPTAHHLGKPQRQHWDIALLQNPPDHSQSTHVHTYDYLKLAAVVEFGLNQNEAHLQDDIERLSHASANVEQGYLVHLYRLSQPGAKFSGRDWAATSKQIVSKEQVAMMSLRRSVEIFYGMADGTGTRANGVWRIVAGEVVPADGYFCAPHS